MQQSLKEREGGNRNCQSTSAPFALLRSLRSLSLQNYLPLLFLFNFSRTAEALLLDCFSLTMILVDVAMEEKSRVLLRAFI